MLDIGVYALSCIRWFMSEAPHNITSQVTFAPTGVDEQVGILLTNPANEMATVSLSLHAKQPKRATIAYDKGYIELLNIREDKRQLLLILRMGIKILSKLAKLKMLSNMR